MYSPPPTGWPEPLVITPFSRNSLGESAISYPYPSTASATWPVANLALFFPFVITTARTYTQAVWENGTVVSGNVDIGIYDTTGARKGSIGSTVQSGTTTTQQANFTTAIALAPGRYYMGMVIDNITATMARSSANVAELRMAGSYQVAAAVPLAASLTFAVQAQSYVPIFGISELSTL